MIAAQKGYYRFIELLLAYGADYNIVSPSDEKTALDFAIEENNYEEHSEREWSNYSEGCFDETSNKIKKEKKEEDEPVIPEDKEGFVNYTKCIMILKEFQNAEDKEVIDLMRKKLGVHYKLRKKKEKEMEEKRIQEKKRKLQEEIQKMEEELNGDKLIN